MVSRGCCAARGRGNLTRRLLMGRSCQGSRCSRSEEPVVMVVEEKRYAESGQVACVKQQVKSKSAHAAVPGPLVLCQRCLRGQLGLWGKRRLPVLELVGRTAVRVCG